MHSLDLACEEPKLEVQTEEAHAEEDNPKTEQGNP
jgi:hypothetical protein